MTATDAIGLAAHDLDLAPRALAAVAELLRDGATVPFISRYRKEATGSLDEVAVTAIRDRIHRVSGQHFTFDSVDFADPQPGIVDAHADQFAIGLQADGGFGRVDGAVHRRLTG